MNQVRQTIHCVPGGNIHIWKNWLPESETLMADLLTRLDWQQRYITIFGKTIPEPRLTAWVSSQTYRYSGLTLPKTVIPNILQQCIERVNSQTGFQFNSVLLNYYRNGDDGMGWHSDDEKELGDLPAIASLSLGQPRRFLVRERGQPTSFEAELGHGDLLLMAPGIQQRCQHSIPKTKRPKQGRISMTFRHIINSKS